MCFTRLGRKYNASLNAFNTLAILPRRDRKCLTNLGKFWGQHSSFFYFYQALLKLVMTLVSKTITYPSGADYIEEKHSSLLLPGIVSDERKKCFLKLPPGVANFAS